MIGTKVDLEAYEQSLLEAEKVGDPKEIGQTKVNLGMALYSIGRLDDALRVIDDAIEIARQGNDKTILAIYVGKRGVILFEAGELNKAQECFLAVLNLAEEVGSNSLKCDALGNIGLVLASTGDPVGSMGKLNDALLIARQMGDYTRELTQLGNIGHTYLQVANIDEAIKSYKLAVQIAKRISNRRAEAGYLNNLGVIYNNISQSDLLVSTFDQVLAISIEIDDKNLAFNALQHLAKAMSSKGNAKQAFQYARRALDILNEVKAPIDQSAIKDILITSLIKEERFYEAVDEIQKDIEEVRLVTDKDQEMILLGQLGDTYLQIGDLEQSKKIYQQALDLSVRLQKNLLQGRLAGRLGAIYADIGEYELSNQYIDRAIRLSDSEKDLQCLAEQYFMRALNYQQMGQVSEGLNFCLKSIEIFSKIGLTAQAQQAQVLLRELQST